MAQKQLKTAEDKTNSEAKQGCSKSTAAVPSSKNTERKFGFTGRPMRTELPDDAVYWRKVFLRGVQMRRNIVNGNYEGYRIYANSDCPVAKLTPDLDLSQVKRDMGNYPKLSLNDDLKIDWNEQYLVVFHFVRREGENHDISTKI